MLPMQAKNHLIYVWPQNKHPTLRACMHIIFAKKGQSWFIWTAGHLLCKHSSCIRILRHRLSLSQPHTHTHKLPSIVGSVFQANSSSSLLAASANNSARTEVCQMSTPLQLQIVYVHLQCLYI